MNRFVSSVERVQRISSALDHLHYVNTTLRMPPRMLTGMMLHHALSECVGVGGVWSATHKKKLHGELVYREDRNNLFNDFMIAIYS